MESPTKIVFTITNGPERKAMLDPPFHLARIAAAIDNEVLMVFTGDAGILFKKGVAAETYSKSGRKSILEQIQTVRAEGVKVYVCSPVLDYFDLKKEDLIEDLDGIVGGMFLITESLEAKVVYTF